MNNIQIVIWPKESVKVGSKWESDIAADKAKGTLDVHTTYEILASEKIGKRDCFKIAFDANEKSGTDPAGSKGTVWIEASSGKLVKSETQWTNAPIAGQIISGKVVLEMTE